MLTSSFVKLSVRIAILICVLASPLYAGTKSGFKSFIIGNPADAPASANLSPGLVLMGGGTDVDAAFQWMCQRAGGGDFLVGRLCRRSRRMLGRVE